MPDTTMLRSTIRRTYFGGTEEICFDNFAIFVVQEIDVAIKLAEDMLDESDGLIENGEENRYHFETYEVIDKDLLRKQLEEGRKNL